MDRIVLHAISKEIVRRDPTDSGTIGLGTFGSLGRHPDLGPRMAQRRSIGRGYRAQAPQALFPTDAASMPHHVILASRILEGDEAQQMLRLWRTQTLDCDEREGVALCHGPNFGLSFYAGSRLLYEVELCWSCQEASFTAGEKDRLSCDFAVNTSAAQALRRILKNNFPDFRTEEDLDPAFFQDWR